MLDRKKIQQLARTVVMAFNVRVADAFTTTRTMQGSIAARVNLDQPYLTGDAVAEPDNPTVLTGISRVVIVQAYRPFKLRITYKTGQLVDVPCSGLFVLYGELDRVEVHADEPLRFTYVKN